MNLLRRMGVMKRKVMMINTTGLQIFKYKRMKKDIMIIKSLATHSLMSI